ncbi:MAG: hypothetical protein ACYCOU_02940 [Sulfobacillus sp.]
MDLHSDSHLHPARPQRRKAPAPAKPLFLEFFQLHNNDAGTVYVLTITPSIVAGRYMVRSWEQYGDERGDCRPTATFLSMSLDELVALADRWSAAEGGPTLDLPDGRRLDFTWTKGNGRLDAKSFRKIVKSSW